MGKVVFMTIKNALDNLPDEYSSSRLLKTFKTGNIFKKVSSFQIFHYDDNFHILHRQTFVNLYYILVFEWFQYLSFHEDRINIVDWTDVLSFDDFDCIFFSCLLILGQKNFIITTLAQQLKQLILSIATCRVEFLTFRHIQNRLILDKIDIFLEIFRTLRVIDPYLVEFEYSSDVLERTFLFDQFHCDWFLIRFSIFV